MPCCGRPIDKEMGKAAYVEAVVVMSEDTAFNICGIFIHYIYMIYCMVVRSAVHVQIGYPANPSLSHAMP